MCPECEKPSGILFQSVGRRWYCKAAVSNLDISISLYEPEICGPCAVPSLCRKFLLLKIESLHVKQSSTPSKTQLTEGVLDDLFNKTDFTASKPVLFQC